MIRNYFAGIYTHHLSETVKQRTSAVAWINCGVGLDKGHFVLVNGDSAVKSADYPASDRTVKLKTQGISDSQFSLGKPAAVAKFSSGKVFSVSVYFHHSKIGTTVRSDYLRGILTFVRKHHRYAFRRGMLSV